MYTRLIELLVILVTIYADLSSAFEWVKDPGTEMKQTYPIHKTLVLKWEWRLSGSEKVNQATIKRYKTKDKDNTDKNIGFLYSDGSVNTNNAYFYLSGQVGTVGASNGYIEFTINDINNQGYNGVPDSSKVDVTVSDYTYECDVTIIAVNTPYSKRTKLVVYVLPGKSVLQLYPNKNMFCCNDIINITCNTVIGSPIDTNLTFFQNNSIIRMIAGARSVNYINAVVTRHMTQPGTFSWSCQATNLAGPSPTSGVVSITVKDPPVITTCTNKTVVKKDNLVWTCDVSGSQSLTISWFKGNTNTVFQSGKSLSIAAVKRNDRGMYRFTASNGGECPTASTTVYLDVQYPPEFTRSPVDTTVTQGDTIILHCQATANPPSSISWTRENNAAIKAGFKTFGNGTLIIPSAKKSDAGKYICTANNVFNSKLHTATVTAFATVKYEPTIVNKSENLIVIEGDPVKLKCKADGYPAPTITWSKSPGHIGTPNTGEWYNISSVKRSNAGTYTCTASNGIGNDATADIKIAVQYKPTIDKAASNTTGTSWNGHSITLRCIWSSANPAPTWTWYKPDGSNITYEARNIDKGSEVKIKTGKDDYGSYRCEANNVAGSDVHQIKVTQLFFPGPPNVTVINIEATTVIVRWTKPAYDGGSPVTGYKLEINSKLYEIKEPKMEQPVDSLTKDTQYEVKLYARNIVGYGKAATTTFRTKKRDRPSIDSISSSPLTIKSWDDNSLILRCMAEGNPIPQVSWIGPDKQPIKYGVSQIIGGSLLTMQTVNRQDYGQYRCRASNSIGHVYRYIEVERIAAPNPPVILKIQRTASTIKITWERSTLDGGSPIIDYQIAINTKPLRAVSVKDISVIIAGLSKATKYQVNVLARNVVGYSNATSTYISTKNEDDRANEQISDGKASKQLSGYVVLGVCLPIIFILLLDIVLILVYNWWKGRKEKKNEARQKSSSNNKEEAIDMNNIALQDQVSNNVSQYESVNNQEQHQSTTQLRQSLQTPSDIYSSLSLNTKVPPRPAVTRSSGVYQDLQGASHPQYQSLDSFSRV